jgi:hypothetical protein
VARSRQCLHHAALRPAQDAAGGQSYIPSQVLNGSTTNPHSNVGLSRMLLTYRPEYSARAAQRALSTGLIGILYPNAVDRPLYRIVGAYSAVVTTCLRLQSIKESAACLLGGRWFRVPTVVDQNAAPILAFKNKAASGRVRRARPSSLSHLLMLWEVEMFGDERGVLCLLMKRVTHTTSCKATPT